MHFLPFMFEREVLRDVMLYGASMNIFICSNSNLWRFVVYLFV